MSSVRMTTSFLAAHVGENLLVRLKLVILGGIIVAVEIQKFAAEQADARAVVLQHGVHVLGVADVAVDADLLAVLRLVGQALELVEQLLALDELGALGHEALTGGIVGVDDHVAGAAVDDDGAALILGLELIAHADDGGDAHGAGEDGGVAGAGAGGGHKAEDLGLVELDGLTGGEVVSREHDGHVGVDAALHDAAEDADDAGGDVLDVGGAGLHVGVVHRGKHLGKLGGHVGDDGLRVAELLLDAVFDGLFVVEVLAHHLVGLEQEGGLVAGLFTRLLGQDAELLDGLGLGGLEAGPLGLKIGDLVAGDGALGALVEVKGTRGNAGGDALALDRDHSSILLQSVIELISVRTRRPRGRRSWSAASRRSRCSRRP